MISIKNLSFSYGLNNILDDVNLSIRKNEFISIVGHNGSGKTTFIKLLLGLLKPKSGNIFFNENDLRPGLRRKSGLFGYINQGAINTSLPITVREVLNIGNVKNYSENTVAETIEMLGIGSLKDRLFKSLSGGQKQKVNIARCLIQKPEIMILDEPNSFLDNESKFEIMEILKKFNIENGITIIMISHDLSLIKEYSGRVLLLENGKIKETEKSQYEFFLPGLNFATAV
jgi:ABC-type Mn2+/Zn2+ transport system ATPase subunit